MTDWAERERFLAAQQAWNAKYADEVAAHAAEAWRRRQEERNAHPPERLGDLELPTIDFSVGPPNPSFIALLACGVEFEPSVEDGDMCDRPEGHEGVHACASIDRLLEW